MLTIKPQDVAALIEAFERSSAQDMRLAAGDFELQLSKSASGVRQSWAPRPERGNASQPERAAAGLATTALAPRFDPPALDGHGMSAASKPFAASDAPPAGHVFVRAANLGTFYRSPKPGAPSYVDIGSRVAHDTEVCLIEVMKLFTPLAAGVQGIIREVLVTDGALVEFDQPLFLIQLDA